MCGLYMKSFFLPNDVSTPMSVLILHILMKKTAKPYELANRTTVLVLGIKGYQHTLGTNLQGCIISRAAVVQGLASRLVPQLTVRILSIHRALSLTKPLFPQLVRTRNEVVRATNSLLDKSGRLFCLSSLLARTCR